MFPQAEIRRTLERRCRDLQVGDPRQCESAHLAAIEVEPKELPRVIDLVQVVRPHPSGLWRFAGQLQVREPDFPAL